MGKTHKAAWRPPTTPYDWRGALTQGAFALSLAIVVARCTMLEALRESFTITPGTKPYPLGPGPASSLALDLLCCVPALLVLLRRAVDRAYVLRWSWSQVLLLPLIGWMALSIRWADDKFATMVSTANFVAAMALLWAMGQLVRSWLRLRLVAAIGFGLLLLSLAYGFYYKFSEMPDMIATFRANETQMIRDRGEAPESFAARQFEKKFLSGEVIGFNASANSFAAMIVLLMTIGLGVAIQRLADRDNIGWTIALALAAPLAGWLLVYTKTKAVVVTPVITIALLGAIWIWRRSLAVHAARWFWGGVAALVLTMAAVVGHGIHHHSLPTDSLNFRWRYWVATWRVFWRHPIRGVGWDNFYLYYLRDRLYSASEEIRDPHNFIIRFFVELGVIGGVLMLAWMGRLWWELTRPFVPPAISAAAASRPHRAIVWLFCAGTAAMIINVIFALDLSQQVSYVIMELLKRIMYLGALTIGSVVVALKSVEQPQIDDRPAPWILYGILVGLGVFLIHNLIEFSLFEPGLLCLFGLLAGSALGVRQPSVAGRRRRTPVAIGVLAAAGALWIAAAIGLYAPTALAESDAHRGDTALRQNELTAAFNDYSAAWYQMKINADYAFRAARALHYGAAAAMHAGGSQLSNIPALALQIQAYYDIAIERNPAAVGPYLWRASFALMMHDGEQAIHDYEKALQLNPNEVSIRLDYARALASLGKRAQANEQFRQALWFNDQLDPAEPKRLSPDQIESIQKEIGAANP